MARVVFGVALLLSGIALAGQTPFIDEFEGDSFDPRWEWRRPLAGPERFLEDGTFVLTMTKAKFDAWDTVDNAPRLRTNQFQTDQDFLIETHLTLEEPATGGHNIC